VCVCVSLSQKERSDCVYVPVLCGQKCDVGLPGETVRYLKRVRVCESALLWRDDIKLLQLHHRGKLSLTLMRDDVLDRYTHTPTYAHTHSIDGINHVGDILRVFVHLGVCIV
jgi:hypothetical protein